MNSHKDVTIYDIAKALDVSAATVSRGLKDHPAISAGTKKRILDKARELHYQHNHFASNLRRNRTDNLGVIVPQLNSPFMSTVIAGMEKVANEGGYNLVISQSLESVKKETANVRSLFNSRVDGLLVSLAYDTEDTTHFDLFLNKNIPFIFFDRVIEHPKCTSIVIDNYKAGYEVTSHLIHQGCRRIVHITANIKRNVYADRLRGYKQALLDHDIPYDEKFVIFNSLNEEASTNAAKAMLQMDPMPDGIFVTNDISAVCCIRELKRYGVRIPEQIAVAGFNNDPICTVIEPNLTTINYPGREMGEAAASTLIRRLNKLDDPGLSTIVLHHDLIIRESSLKKQPR